MDIHILAEIEAVGSRLSKEKLLSKLKPGSIRFLAKVLDPMITFGVTADEEHLIAVNRRHEEKWTEEKYWEEFFALLGKLESRSLTGHNAQRAIEHVISHGYREEAVLWSCRILNKNLRIGVQTTTLNEVFPGTVEEWDVALAEPFDPDKHELKGEFIREPKLDGLRGINYQGKMYTRNGRVIESVGHILKELEVLGEKYVFDGELMGVGDFDEASGQIRRKGNGPDSGIFYNVFDCIDIDGWKRRDTFSLRKRKEHLQEIFDAFEFQNVKMVPWVALSKNPDAKTIADCGDAYIADGFEGAMIKDLDSPYIFKRSTAILKVKRFAEVDAVIASVYEGKGRHEGKAAGGVFVEYKGVQTKVGSGFSDEQRVELWKAADNFIGRTVEVSYQPPINKSGKLRFPIFLKYRPDKD